MNNIAIQYDKRSGLSYAYEVIDYIDEETDKKRKRRILIGRYNPETKEITPTSRHRIERKYNFDGRVDMLEKHIKVLENRIRELERENKSLRKKLEVNSKEACEINP